MKIYFSRPAGLMLKTIMAGALSAGVCFGQAAPQQGVKAGSAHKSPPHKPAASASSSPAQKVVLTVGNAKVTQQDMDFLVKSLSPQLQQAVATHGRAALGEEYSLMLLLSQKAVSDHLDATPTFRREIELQKNQMLAQAEYHNLASQAKINPDEISAYYAAHKDEFEEASVREFVVRKKAEDAKPSEPGLSSQEAKARLDAIRQAVAGGKDIAEVAKQFDVPNVVMIEPEARKVRRGQLLPPLDKAAFNLKDNQFSEPVETEHAMVLLQVLSHQQSELKDVSSDIEDTLRKQKVKSALDDLKAKAHIWMDPEYFKSQPAPEASSSEAAPETPAQP